MDEKACKLTLMECFSL